MRIQSSLYCQFWINTWKSNSSKRQTVFFLLVDSRDKRSQGSLWNWLNECTTSCTIFAQCMEETSFFCDSKRINILSDSIECNHPSRILPAYCVPKVVGWKTGEVIYEKVYMSLRPPSEISLKHDWKRELGPSTCSTTRKTSWVTFKKFQSNNQFLNPCRERKRETRWQGWHENCARWKENVPFSGDRC